MASEHNDWTVADARALYGVDGWGLGYFSINGHGHLIVHPTKEPDRGLDLYEIATSLRAQGLGAPVLLRFPDILRTRIEALVERFSKAMRECDYTGAYTLVYPIKVNQQRCVLEDIIAAGDPYGVGLEVGSRPELQAALALSDRTDHLIVCNGYKDEKYVHLALMGQRLGHQVMIVIERLSEADLLLRLVQEMGIQPFAGVRIKLTTSGAGRWSGSTGDDSKFGLSASELMHLVDKLRAVGETQILRMIHFHLGSQIPDILNVKQAMTEVARYYVELRDLGLDITHVDVGGGLGVDYDGSRSRAEASVNYSIQEYANDVVYTLAEACRENRIPMPDIISESGRALTAHHSLLLVDVIHAVPRSTVEHHEIPDGVHPVVNDLATALREIDDRSLREVYHDASFWQDRLRSLFNSGVVSLPERSLGERLFRAIMTRGAESARRHIDRYGDILPLMEAMLVDQYVCNFSLFQSLPDSWAIDQLFPIMPIHRLGERPTRRATLQDITCDSDGKIDRFVGGGSGGTGLHLHSVDRGESYTLGVFLTGAYQEILGDLHNLLGDTNTVGIRLDDGGAGRTYGVSGFAHGDTVGEVLTYVEFDRDKLIANFRKKVQSAAGISPSEAELFVAAFIANLAGYTYLERGLST